MKERRNRANLAYIRDHYTSPSYQQEDEINLGDIWRILARQKKVIFRVLLVCSLLGSVFSLLKPQRYPVSTAVQIGSLHSDDKGIPVPIELTQDVVEKINSAYIPLVLAEHNAKNPDNMIQYEIEASMPKNTNIISVKTACKSAYEQTCKALIDEIVQKIKTDHSAITGLSRKNLEVKLASAENALSSSKDEVKFIASKKQRLLQTSELLSVQLKEKKVLLESALKSRSKITSGNAAGAMLALQMDNEIKKYQELIDSLELRLTVGINQELDDLDKAETANAHLQNDQENTIGQIKTQLLSINNTKAVAPALMATKPIGMSRLLGIVLSLLFGLFLGIFAAFFWEFLVNTKEQDKKRATI